MDIATPGVHILVVDDDLSVSKAVAEYLSSEGYVVHQAADGAQMRKVLSEEDIALVLLDVMLPGEDGFALARELSDKPDIGVIMVSARGSEVDRITGLELGADDYLPKPASPRELLARVRAVQRRYTAKPAPLRNGFCYVFGGWSLDPVRRVLRTSDGILVSLSEGEFELLLAFVENPQTVLSRDELLELARGEGSDAFDRAIDVQVSRLRRKLAGCSATEVIRTIRGEGYMFAAEVATA